MLFFSRQPPQKWVRWIILGLFMLWAVGKLTQLAEPVMRLFLK